MKQKIRNYIDKHQNELFQTIQELVQIETVVGNEFEGQQYIKQKYKEIGLDVHEFEPCKEELMRHEAFVDSGISFTNRNNIIGIHKGQGDGKSLTLHGHMDVVSAEPVENWSINPWSGEIKGNKLYGRGSADMKSGLVANWFALKTLIDLDYPIAGDVQLHCVIEEEAGGGGGALACLEKGYRTDGYISSEPHQLQMTISHAGIMYFRIKVTGKTAHAGLAHEGVNAIAKMYPIFQALEQLGKWRGEHVRFDLYEQGSGQSVHLNTGVMQAGDWVSTVPGEAVLECRIGFIPGESRKQMKQLVHDTVFQAIADDDWFEKHPPIIEWFGWSTEPWYQDPQHPFVTTFKRTSEQVLKHPIHVIGRASGNDARFTRYYDMPGLCFGPIGENMHGPDENVDLASVIDVTNVFAHFIIDWTES